MISVVSGIEYIAYCGEIRDKTTMARKGDILCFLGKVQVNSSRPPPPRPYLEPQLFLESPLSRIPRYLESFGISNPSLSRVSHYLESPALCNPLLSRILGYLKFLLSRILRCVEFPAISNPPLPQIPCYFQYFLAISISPFLQHSFVFLACSRQLCLLIDPRSKRDGIILFGVRSGKN